MSELDEYWAEYNHSQEWSEADLHKIIADKIEDALVEYYWRHTQPLEQQLEKLGQQPNVQQSNYRSLKPVLRNGCFFTSVDDYKADKTKYHDFLKGLHDKLRDSGLMESTHKVSLLDFYNAFSGISEPFDHIKWVGTKNLCPYLIDVLIDKRIIQPTDDYNEATKHIFSLDFNVANNRNQYRDNSLGKPVKHQIIDDIVDSLL